MMNTERRLIENCMKVEKDLFKLVVLAAHRAHELYAGISHSVHLQKNKNIIVSLQEIASGVVSLEELTDRTITSYQRFAFLSEKKHGESFS